jgi:signal transduction histidine kinase
MRLSRPLNLPVTGLAKLSPYYGVLVKTAWVALSLFGLVMLALSLPEYWHNLTSVCQITCHEAQPTELGLAMLSRFGFGVEFYAAVTLIAHLLVPLSIMTAMGFVIWHKPLNPVVISLAFGGVAVSLVDGLLLFYAASHPWFTFPLQVLWVIAGIGINLGTFTFPDGKFVPSWGRYAAYLGATASFLVFVPGDPQLSDSGKNLALTALLLTAPVVFVCQIIRYFRTDSAKIKQQLKWVLYTVGVSIAVIMMIFILHSYAPQSWTVVGAPGDLFSTLSLNAITIAFWLCIAALVYVHNLFDINLVIKRTLVYGGLSAAIAVLYVLLVSGVTWLLKTPNQNALMLLAVLPVAFIVRPLFITLQRVTSRWFPVTKGRLESPPALLPQSVTWKVVRVAWLVLGLFLAVLMLWGLPLSLREQMTVCTEPACKAWQLSAERVALLEQAGISLRFYALWTTLTTLLVPLLGFTLVGLMVWRMAGNWVAYFMALVLLSCVANYPNSLRVLATHYPWMNWLSGSLDYITMAVIVPVLCAFPDGRFVPRWSRWLILPSLLLLIPLLFEATQSEAFRATQSFSLVTVAGLWNVLSTFLVAGFLIYRYRISGLEARKQIWWVVMASLVVSVLYPLIPALATYFETQPLAQLLLGTAHTLTSLFLITSIGIAMLFYNLFDVGMVIRRTLVYGGLTLGIALIYVMFIALTGVLTLGNNNLLVSLLATGVIALAFQPLRERLQRGVNRLLYGYRDEPYKVLSQLGQRLESTSQPTSVLPATVQTIAETLKLPYAAISLNEGGIIASYGEAQKQQESFPLTYGGETLGELVVSPRQSEEAISKADRRLLSDLARQAGVAAHALLLQADLERSRLRVVSAREEARRRLGNDLHDSVGHQLAGLMRRAETASNLLERDPQTARKLLNELVQGSKGAIEHVRSLAHQLHPPELEVLGLADAIREKIQTFEHSNELRVYLETHDLPKLPTAVEVAAYYIVQEALNNVLRHAKATRCHIHLKMLNDITLPTLTALATPVLELEVVDNGCGLTNTKRNGLGLSSMCERATEVGGTCKVETLARGGTRVLVHLPCPAL